MKNRYASTDAVNENVCSHIVIGVGVRLSCACTGYCQISCGRCDCCSTLVEVLGNNSLSFLAQAADIAGLSAQLSPPGTSLTLLAPTDAAFEAALPALGELPALLPWGQTCTELS